MDDSHESTLRANAMDMVPFPLNGNYLYGGVYSQIDLDLTNQGNGEEVYVNDVIVLDGGHVAGNFVGTMYVPEGVGERVEYGRTQPGSEGTSLCEPGADLAAASDRLMRKGAGRVVLPAPFNNHL